MSRTIIWLIVLSQLSFIGFSACSREESNHQAREATEETRQGSKRKSLKDPIDKAHAVRALEEERARTSEEAGAER